MTDTDIARDIRRLRTLPPSILQQELSQLSDDACVYLLCAVEKNPYDELHRTLEKRWDSIDRKSGMDVARRAYQRERRASREPQS